MTILHIVSSLDPKSGGPTRSISGLCRSLAACGVKIVLFSHVGEFGLKEPGNVIFKIGQGLSWHVVKSETARIIDVIKPDIVHLHGLWMVANHVAVKEAQRRNIPYVIAPRGMLEPWSLNAKKWKKRMALWLYQRQDLQRATALHATADAEARQFRNLGYNQRIIVSPNGVELPAIMPQPNRGDDGKKVILFLSRIHPKKSLLNLVNAWAEGGFQATHGNNWCVEFAGPDYGGHLAEIRQRISDLRLTNSFSYLGDLSDSEKWQAYRRAALFVLPTQSENFGIVVAEALAAGVPVITTKGAPWQELEERKCGWWVEIGVTPLVKALREAMSLSDAERAAMGERGRRLVEERYAWPAIAEQMKRAYEEVLAGAARDRHHGVK